MSSILKTDAIILRSYRLGESSKIVVCYTRNFGKIRVVAKGSRKTKSKFGGTLELFTHSSIVFYKKETRDLQTLSDSSIIRPFIKIREDLTKLSIVSAMLELINHIIPDEEPNPHLFNLLLEIFNQLNNAENNFMSFYYYFQLHLLTHVGYKLFLQNCKSCQKTFNHEKVFFLFDSGDMICETCSEPSQTGFEISLETVRILGRLQTSSPKKVETFRLSKKAKFELSELLTNYYKYHVEGIKKLRSLEVLLEMDKGLGINETLL